MKEKVKEAYPCDPAGAMRWIKAVDTAKSADELQDVPYPELEIAVSKAMKKIISRDKIFHGKVTQMIEKSQQDDTNVTSRQIIWHMYHHLMPRQRGENMFDLQDLFAIGLGADSVNCNVHELELFLMKWEHVVTGMSRPPDNDTKFTLFYGLIKKIKLLDFDMQGFERLPEHEKTFDRLFEICLSIINRHRAEKNQRNLHGKLKMQPFTVAAAPRSRSQGSYRSLRSNTGKSRSNSRERGRTFSRGSSRSAGRRNINRSSPSRSPGGRQKFKRSSKGKICVYFLKGKCAKGAGCKYKHDRTSPSPQRVAPSPGRGTSKDKSRTLSRSPTRYKPVCNHYSKNKTCPYGDKCKFAHSEPSAPATPNDKSSSSVGNRSANSPAPEDSFH